MLWKTIIAYRVRYAINVDFMSMFDSFTSTACTLKSDVAVALSHLLAGTKSPGSPLCYAFSNNASVQATIPAEFLVSIESTVFKWYELGSKIYADYLADPVSLRRAFNSLDFDRNLYDAECMRLIEMGATQPILVKKKGELRKHGKLPRLVCLVSSITNQAMRVVLNDFLQDEQSRDDLSVATALDIITPDKTDSLYAEFVLHSPVVSTDVQGFEYSVTPVFVYANMIAQAIHMNLVSDIDLTVVPGREQHLFALIGMTYCGLYRLIQTVDGCLFTSPPGMVSSGKLTTFSDNSRIRTFQGDVITLSLNMPLAYAKAAGDDHVSSAIPEGDAVSLLQSAYQSYGIVITDVEIQRTNFSFCSTTFAAAGAYQDNILKALATLLFSPRTRYDAALLISDFGRSNDRHPDYLRYLELVEDNIEIDDS